MGDAFDDWLIEKIQRLRRGSVVASGIKRLEQVGGTSILFILIIYLGFPIWLQFAVTYSSKKKLYNIINHYWYAQILWPDGIFITKHPRRLRPPVTPSHGDQPSTPYSSPKKGDPPTLEEMQKEEAERRAKLVYELMIGNIQLSLLIFIIFIGVIYWNVSYSSIFLGESNELRHFLQIRLQQLL